MSGVRPAPRSAPDHEATGWPPGIPYIIGNEGCERFSFYGMRSILTLYLARVLYVHHPAVRRRARGRSPRRTSTCSSRPSTRCR